MYKIAVLGDRDSIYGFATLGLETFPVANADEGEDVLKRLAMTDYAVIYITESLKAKIEDTIEKFRDQKLPAIIPIPGVSGNTGQGMVDVKRLVEQAVGSDIIFNNENLEIVDNKTYMPVYMSMFLEEDGLSDSIVKVDLNL